MGKTKVPVTLTEPQKRRFNQLWAPYPNKTSKGEAKRSFLKYDPDDKELARWLKAIEIEKRYKLALQRAGKWCPEWKHLSTWINKEAFDDEYDFSIFGKKSGDDYNKQSDPAPFEKVPKVRDDV